VQKTSAPTPPARGRPPAQTQRHVIQDIIAATEEALAKTTAKELTIREISLAAGINEAMIRYYFGSKEGLLITMLEDFMKEGPHAQEKELLKSCIEKKSIRPLVDALANFYYSHPNIMRMIIVETFSASSELKNAYISRYGRSTYTLVRSIIDGMKDANIYRKDVDSAFLATFIPREIVGPIVQPTAAGVPPMPPQIGSSDLMAYIARTTDSESM
jgi:AcrR family transcriptional regulator